MTISVYSHKNRPYKPLIKKCMGELLVFFKELERILDSKEFWRLYMLSPSIEIFGDSIAKAINKKEDKDEVNFCITEQSPKNLWKGILTIPPHKFTINKNEMKMIYKTLKILKNIKKNEKNDGGAELIENVAQEKKKVIPHFLFLGEYREIPSDVINIQNSFSADDLEELIAGISLPSIYFEKSSLKVIKSGVDIVETEEGSNIITKLNVSYVIIPVTPFADSLMRAYKVHFVRMDKPFMINGKDQKFKYHIPIIFNDKFESFYQMVCSMIIQYYLSFEGFEAIKVCENCGSIFLEKKTGSALYCSNNCRRIIWADENKEKEEKSKCRNRQNVWLSRNTKCGQEREYKEFCEACDIVDFPKGGKCPQFLEKYGADVEEFKKFKKEERQAHKKV